MGRIYCRNLLEESVLSQSVNQAIRKKGLVNLSTSQSGRDGWENPQIQIRGMVLSLVHLMVNRLYSKPWIGKEMQNQQQWKTARPVPEITSDDPIIYGHQVCCREHEGFLIAD